MIKREYNLKYLYSISIIAAFGGFTSNFSMSVMTGALPFLNHYFKFSNVLLGLTISSLAIGAIAGSALSGKLPDRIGRKKTLIIASLIFLFSTLLAAFSFTPYDLIFYRIFTGFAVGMTSVAAPMYLAELAPPEKRGIMVTFYQLAIVTGIMLSYIVDYLLTGTVLGWRLMLGAASVPSVMLLILLQRLPESPRWLIMKNMEAQGRLILSKIGGESYANKIFASTKQNIGGLTKKSLKELFQKKYFKVLVVGSILTVIQQWSGTNLIFSYSPMIYESIGFSASNAVFQTIFIGIVNFGCTIISIRLIEIFGRKKLLLYGLTSNILTLIFIGLYFQLHLNVPWLLVLSFLLSVAAFAATLGPVMWIVIAEISPSAIRSQAMSVFIFSLWIAGMLGTFTFPILKAVIGSSMIFYFYSLICLISIWFISRFIPETKDKPLEEIEAMWDQPV
jgi:MFS transporter, SP family, arabinose:H+ symporter